MLRWDLKSNPNLKPISQFLDARKYDKDYANIENVEFPDETLIKDLEKAVDRIIKALRKNEKIVIFGDDDVDGITSTYLIFDYLKKIGSQNHFFYIRNRNTDVHGLSDKFIERVKQQKYNLVITVDSCISSFDKVVELNELGVDTIITDHHLIPAKLPPAYAIVDSKQEDCQYPDKMLAGVGVAFMLVRLLSKKIQVPYSDNYLLWTAIGSVIDKAPLKKINLFIVKLALANWENFNDNSLYAINYNRKLFSVQQKMNLINYIGRVLSAGKAPKGTNKAFELLIAPLSNKSAILQTLLQEKKAYDDQLRSVSRFLETLSINYLENVFIYYDKEKKIPLNLMGFSASFLSSKYKIPILFLQEKDGVLTCEGRCTEGYDLVNSFEYCSEYIIQFGGHVKAAGFSLEIDNYEKFLNKYQEYVDLKREVIEKNKKIDIDIIINKYDDDMYERLMEYCPFGEGNNLPIILQTDFVKSNNPELTIDHFCNIDFEKSNDIVFKFKDEKRIEIIDFKEKSR